MADEEDFLWRPVAHGMVQAQEIHGTRLTIVDFARMNDALDVRAENEYRVNKPTHGK